MAFSARSRRSSAASTSSGAAAGSARMSERRRNKLKDIQRRAMLQDTLTQKLVNTYQDSFKDKARARRVVQDEVSKLIRETAVPSLADLEDLQARVESRSMLSAASRYRREASDAEEARVRRLAQPAALAGVPPASSRTSRTGRSTGRSSLRSSRGNTLAASASNLMRSNGHKAGGAAKLGVDGTAKGMAHSSSSPSLSSARSGAQSPHWPASGRSIKPPPTKFNLSSSMYGQRQDLQRLDLLPPRKKVPGPEDRRNLEWNMLDRFENDAWKEEQAALKRKEIEKRMVVVEGVGKQQAEKQERAKRAKQQEQEYAQQVLQRIKDEEAKEKEKLRKKREKELAAKAEFDKLVRREKEIKEREARAAKKEDEELAKFAAAQARAVEEEMRRKKEAYKAKMKNVLKENEAEQKKKEALEAKERAADAAILQQAIDLAEKKEQERIKAMQFHAKLAEPSSELVDEIKRKQAAIELEAKRVEAAARAKEQQDAKIAEARAKAAEARKSDMLHVLEQQIKEKEAAKRRKREAERAEAERVRRQIQEAEQAEKQKQLAMRQRHLEHRKALESQIRGQADRLDDPTFIMNDTERRLNYDRLERAMSYASTRRSERGSPARSTATSILSRR